jgi:hypothetical protein
MLTGDDLLAAVQKLAADQKLPSMIEKETTYKLTLTEIQAIKLFHLLMNNCDGELWDNDLETIYYEMNNAVDTERFNLYMETGE